MPADAVFSTGEVGVGSRGATVGPPAVEEAVVGALAVRRVLTLLEGVGLDRGGIGGSGDGASRRKGREGEGLEANHVDYVELLSLLAKSFQGPRRDVCFYIQDHLCRLFWDTEKIAAPVSRCVPLGASRRDGYGAISRFGDISHADTIAEGRGRLPHSCFESCPTGQGCMNAFCRESLCLQAICKQV